MTTVQESLKTGDAEISKDATDMELRMLKEMKCWTVEERPPQVVILSGMCLLNRKCDAKGKVENYKERMMVRWIQRYEIGEEFSVLVSNFLLLKLIMSIAKQQVWQLRHYDVQNGFPNGELHWSVYVEFRKWKYLQSYRNENVINLRKSLNGLKSCKGIARFSYANSPRNSFHWT